MAAFLEILESLEREKQNQDMQEPENFKDEKDTANEVFNAWRDYILVPFNREASRRLEQGLQPREDEWQSVQENLRKKIAEMNTKLRSVVSSKLPNQMPVASPWETLLVCMLLSHDPPDESR
ncbi:MAG: hypothetical protein LQ338_008083, partial [Usnochroma carphineum]